MADRAVLTGRYGLSSAENYFIGVDASELERLRHQHEAWRPETEALWTRADIHTGLNVIDLGSGPGYTAIDLARRVGPTGRVTALDKASAFLDFVTAEARREAVENVEPLERDITAIDIIEGSYDRAFCRFFLAFLINDLDSVLRCIYRSLRPGGQIAAMEYLTLSSATCSPPARGFDAHTRAWIRYYQEHGGDTAIGSYLPDRLGKAGFAIEYLNCVGGMARSGTRWWNWWGRLISDFGEKLAAAGLMSTDDLQCLRQEWRERSADPGAFIYTPVLLQVVARKT
jgi:ubiquinone/menaquinone biosynthesis C-methylase UbiE